MMDSPNEHPEEENPPAIIDDDSDVVERLREMEDQHRDALSSSSDGLEWLTDAKNPDETDPDLTPYQL